jgi:H+/Cl- antiporter ClcA
VADPSDSFAGRVTAVVDISKAYARQEVVGPLKHLGRFVGLGLAGAVFLGLGAIMLALALLRFLQEDAGSWTTGNWSWLPYLLVSIPLALAAVLALSRIPKVWSQR